jgi:hypothetical protein
MDDAMFDFLFRMFGLRIENAARDGNHIKSIPHSALGTLFDAEIANMAAKKRRRVVIPNNNRELQR